jgi:hypothetical protein
MIVFRNDTSYSPDSPYGYPQARCFYLALGDALDTSNRTQLQIWENTTELASVPISITENIYHDLILTLDTTNKILSVDLDAGSYTLSAAISPAVWSTISTFTIEFGHSNYSKTVTEAFDHVRLCESSSSSSSVSDSSSSRSSSSSSLSSFTVEDLLTYTEVDSDGDITVTSPSASFVTMRQDADSYVYKDFGASYFGDFDIEFEAEITFSEAQGAPPAGVSQALLCSVSNTIGNFPDFDTANDGIMIDTYNLTGQFLIRLRDFSNDNSDLYDMGGVFVWGKYYFKFERSGTTATCKIYSDSARTILVDTLSITCETGDKRYLNVLASRDQTPTASNSITGYTQNFDIISA